MTKTGQPTSAQLLAWWKSAKGELESALSHRGEMPGWKGR